MSANSSSRAAPRHPGLLLYAPAALLFLVLLAACVGWLWGRAQLTAQMDARADALRQAGWQVSWSDRRVGGFPFRLKLMTQGLTVQAPGAHAWGFSIPALTAQAYIALPNRWVIAAPQGLTVERPDAGALKITGKDLRASIAGVTTRPWRFAFAGDQVRFETSADAPPFSFTTVEHVEAHLRPSGQDSGAKNSGAQGPEASSGDADVLLQVDGGRAAPSSVLRRVADDAPITFAASGRLAKLAQAKGADPLSAWAAAGGTLHIEKLGGAAGTARLTGRDGVLGVDAQGRLEGSVPLTLTQAAQPAPDAASPATPAAQAAAQAAAAGGSAQFPLVFKDGRARLGPFEAGPAPTLR
jgi:hypothetical protein